MSGTALIVSALAVFVFALVRSSLILLTFLLVGGLLLPGAIAVVAVGMSALLHGMSAAPAPRWFGRQGRRRPRENS